MLCKLTNCLSSKEVKVYQSLHVVDTGGDESNVVVAEVEFPQTGEVGEGGRQGGQLVIG